MIWRAPPRFVVRWACAGQAPYSGAATVAGGGDFATVCAELAAADADGAPARVVALFCDWLAPGPDRRSRAGLVSSCVQSPDALHCRTAVEPSYPPIACRATTVCGARRE